MRSTFDDEQFLVVRGCEIVEFVAVTVGAERTLLVADYDEQRLVKQNVRQVEGIPAKCGRTVRSLEEYASVVLLAAGCAVVVVGLDDVDVSGLLSALCGFREHAGYLALLATSLGGALLGDPRSVSRMPSPYELVPRQAINHFATTSEPLVKRSRSAYRECMTANDDSGVDRVRAWLFNSDPALKWQVERDLLHAPEAKWQRTRARVAHEGFAAHVLSKQDEDGQWAGGAYFPTRRELGVEVVGSAEGQPWVATTWALNELREWGLEASVLGDTAQRIAQNSRWEYDDLPYWDGEVDVCINAYTLANGAWLGVDVSGLAEWFRTHQLDDGGWNCEWEHGATRSSFHSTLSALFGLLEYEQRTGDAGLRDVRHRGEGYLLERNLMRRKTSGDIVAPWVTDFIAPARHQYSALRALDYFRAASLHDGVGPNPRLDQAIGVVRSKQQRDGRWLQGRPLDGIVWVTTDVEEGKPSKWVTLQALRVLGWWESTT